MKTRRDALIELTAVFVQKKELTTVLDAVNAATWALDLIDDACGYKNMCPVCDGKGSCQSAECAAGGAFICDGACARCGGVGFTAWEVPSNGGPMLGEENS